MSNDLFFLFVLACFSLDGLSQGAQCEYSLQDLLNTEISSDRDNYLTKLQVLKENCGTEFQSNDSLLAIVYLLELRSLYCICEDPLQKEKLELIKEAIESRPHFHPRVQAIFERYYSQYLHSTLGKKEEAAKFMAKSYERISTSNPIDSNDLLYHWARMAVYKLYLKDEAKEGQGILQKILKDLEENSKQNTEEWLEIATDYLFHTYEMVDLDSVLVLAHRIKKVAHQIGLPKHSSLLTVYKQLGQAYSRKKDYYHALKYYRLFENQANFIDSRKNLAMAQYQIGTIYFDMKDFKTATQYFLKVFNHQKLNDYYDYHAAQTHRRLAACYLYLDDEQQSQYHENIIRSYYKKLNIPLFQVIIDKTLADAELANGKFLAASKKYKTAIKEWSDQFGFINHHVISSYAGFADAMLGMGQLDSALHYCNKTKLYLNYSSKNRSIDKVDDLDLLSRTLNVECRIKRFLYQNHPTEKTLDSLDAIYDEFLEVFDAIRLNYKYGKSTQLLLRENLNIIEMGIAHFTKRYQEESSEQQFGQVLHFVEISQSFQNILLLESANIRESKEAEALLDMKKQLDLMTIRTNSGETQLEDSIRQLSIAYDEATSALQHNNPLRKETQFNPLTSVEEIRKTLKDDQAMVLFYQGEKDIFGIAIGKTFQELYHWKNDLQSDQDKLIESIQISNVDVAKQSMDSLYARTTAFFYSCISTWKKAGIRTLSVYSDGWLTALGMNLTMAYHSEFRDSIESSNILSVQQFIHQANHKKEFSGNKLLAIVPSYEQSSVMEAPLALRSGNIELPFAQEEVEKIIEILGGDVLKGSHLEKQALMEAMGSYDIIHFAGHTVMNREFPSQSRLLLNSGDEEGAYLSSADIHHLKLDSKLTTLSSCNSGVGKYSKLSGFNSLAKSFYYAGSESLLASLWQVPDHSTKKIMEYFYSFLKEGLSKTEALKLAKGKYIESAMSEEELHPFYWSGFVIIGSNEQIITEGQKGIWYIIFSLIVVLAAILLFRNLKSS